MTVDQIYLGQACSATLIQYIDYLNMKKILAALLLLCIVQRTLADQQIQQIPINPSMTLAAEIPEDYSIVHTYLYPSTTHSVTTLPKDFYVKKLQDSNISRIVQKVSEPENVGPKYPNLSFANEQKEIKIMSSQAIIPSIRDYHAVISIYPDAKIQQPEIYLKPIEVTFDKPLQTIQQAQTQDKSLQHIQPAQAQVMLLPKQSGSANAINHDKQIEWKVKNVPPVRDYVIEGGKQYPLSKSLTTFELGTAQIGIQGSIDVKSPQPLARTQTPPPAEQKKPLLYNNPNIPTQSPNLNIQKVNPIQDQVKEAPRPIQSNEQILKQIQKLRYKSHKWSIIIVILILVILFIVFLFIKCLGKRDIEFWQSLNKKLDNYRNSSEVAVDEEEQVMTNKSNELIQNEQQ